MFILTSANTHAVIQIITSPQTHAATMFIIQLFKHTHTEKCLKGAEYIVLKVEITQRLKHTVASGICRSVYFAEKQISPELPDSVALSAMLCYM